MRQYKMVQCQSLMPISLIMPVLNEADGLGESLLALQPFKRHCEIIVVDGGSCDNTCQIAQNHADKVLNCAPGRAIQMNHGARHAQGTILLFLHADTRLPDNALQQIRQALDNGAVWGRFDIRLSGHHPAFRIIAFMMNWRSRLTGITTGDQALFIRRDVFEQIQGFRPLPLMEDIDISSRLKRLYKPCCLTAKVISSSRRWQQFGILRTILLMWWLRIRYFFGCDVNTLAECYREGRFWKP